MLVQSKRFDSGYKPEPTKNEYPRLRRCVNSHFFSFTTNHRLSFRLDWKAYLVVRWLICCLSMPCFSSALLPMQIKMESAGNTINMVFLDACRDNPLLGVFVVVQKGLPRWMYRVGRKLYLMPLRVHYLQTVVGQMVYSQKTYYYIAIHSDF